MGIRLLRSTSNLGRKRIMMPKQYSSSDLSYEFEVPLQKRQSRKLYLDMQNGLQALPMDILVRILCKVDHSDLKHLLLVSKFVSEATLIAKELHFAFSTPDSKCFFNKQKKLGSHCENSEQETPSAPQQYRVRKSRIDGLKLSGIAVALFATQNDDQWPKNEIACEM